MIEVRDLKKSFGSHTVLDGVSLRIERGESIVIIGRSGGGKSVLLKHLIGLLQADSGDVLIDGQSVGRASERELINVRRKFGMLFQGAALFDSLSVEENIAFPLWRRGKLTDSEIAGRVEKALAMVELSGTQEKRPSELSGGMRKRVGLARAIVYDPEIILYDEPTTGLDPVVSDSIDQLMLRVWRRLGCTSVVVTHDMRSAKRVGQRILMLHQGRIHASGQPEEIFRSHDPVVSRFVNGIADVKESNL